MQVHLIQACPLWEARAANRAAYAEWLEGCARIRPGDLVLLPELAFSGFSMNVQAVVQSGEREDECWLAEMAARSGALWLAGVATEVDGRARNQLVGIDPSGAEVTRYTKQKLFLPGNEHQAFQAGNGLSLWNWQGVRFASHLCFELRFPELAWQAVEQGAEVLVYAACWPRQRAAHWRALLVARAIENQAWVLGCNRAGEEPDVSYAGGSLVIDPQGCVIAEADEEPQILSVELDVEQARSWRAAFPIRTGCRDDA